ncbi:hypothetical protein [Microbacterium sp. NPDC079356]|uniref:hypothetical protein n=1 Tax=Microbacterium TaxID=33882 RepID=UPI003C2D9096
MTPQGGVGVADEVFVPLGRPVVVLAPVDLHDQAVADEQIDPADGDHRHLGADPKSTSSQAEPHERFQPAVGIALGEGDDIACLLVEEVDELGAIARTQQTLPERGLQCDEERLESTTAPDLPQHDRKGRDAEVPAAAAVPVHDASTVRAVVRTPVAAHPHVRGAVVLQHPQAQVARGRDAGQCPAVLRSDDGPGAGLAGRVDTVAHAVQHTARHRAIDRRSGNARGAKSGEGHDRGVPTHDLRLGPSAVPRAPSSPFFA